MDTAAVDHHAFARDQIGELRAALDELSVPDRLEQLVDTAVLVSAALGRGGKVLFCGNGGSAADAQHLAAELVGRQNYDRGPLAGLALTVDTSALTAIANDYGYEEVFSRQVSALGRPGDVLIGLSTSGRSASVVRALEAARRIGMRTVAFTGREPRDLGGADVVVAVPSSETAKIQELHITCGHIVFALVERMMCPRP